MKTSPTPKTDTATERGPITSASVYDGDGNGAGTAIKQENGAVLKIWRDGSGREIPLKTAASAPDMLAMLRSLSAVFNDRNFTDRGRYGERIDALIASATGAES